MLLNNSRTRWSPTERPSGNYCHNSITRMSHDLFALACQRLYNALRVYVYICMCIYIYIYIYIYVQRDDQLQILTKMLECVRFAYRA